MTFDDYSKCIKKNNPAFYGEGTKISKVCRNLLEGMLNKNLEKRIGLHEIESHPWIIKMRRVVSEIQETFQTDPEKMILELNKKHLKEEDFNDLYLKIEIDNSDKMLNKKRKKNNCEIETTDTTNNFSAFFNAPENAELPKNMELKKTLSNQSLSSQIKNRNSQTIDLNLKKEYSVMTVNQAELITSTINAELNTLKNELALKET